MTTEILDLSEIIESQASKYVTHNTALRQIEGRLVRVLSATTTAEPGSPSEGDTYIIPSGATGTDWSGFAQGDIAHFYGGAWTNWTPIEGARVWVNDEDELQVWDGASWGALTTAAVISMPVLEKTGDYTVTTGDAGKLIAVTDTTSARTITLPAAATAADGFLIGVYLDDATNKVTVDANGSETIDGVTSFDLTNDADSVILVCDGTEWRTVASTTGGGGGGSHLSMTVLEKTADYTVQTADDGEVIAVTDTTTARTITLPAAATAGDGFTITVYLDDATNKVTIDPNASETIDGAASLDLTTGGDSVMLVCDGTEWRSVADTLKPTGAGSGDVTGPASSTDNAIARFNGTTGKSIQNSSPTIDDAGNLDLKDNQLQKAEIKDYSETVATPTSSAGTLTLDMALANVFEPTPLTENVTIAISNPPSSGRAGSITIILQQDGTGGRTVTLPAGARTPGGSALGLSTAANAVDVLTFVTTDGGTTWYGFLAGKGMA